MAGFEAVLFDLDGTLCERTQDTELMYAAAFKQVGVEPFGDPKSLWASLEGPPDHDDWIGYIGAGFARLAAQHGRTEVDPLALAAAVQSLVDDAAVALRPGARIALDHAASVGPVGLVTNGPAASQRTKLDSLGITDRFSTMVFGAELPRKKPHARPFNQAVTRIGVPPSRALYVGNSLEYDVSGAQMAGLSVAWLCDDGDDPGPYSPEYILEELGELPAVIKGDR